MWERHKKHTSWWPIRLIHPSQPLWLTNSRLGKLEWKESKKKTSIICNHYSSRPSSWGRETRNCELRWLRGVARRAVTPLLSIPTLTRVIVRRHTHPDDTLSRLIMRMRKTFPLVTFLLDHNQLIPLLTNLTSMKLLAPSEESERWDNNEAFACLTLWGPAWGPKTNKCKHHHTYLMPWRPDWANRNKRCHQAFSHRRWSCQ